ncbi:hypothetical protein [Moraxella boevrei]
MLSMQGDLVSEYVLPDIKFDDEIKIVAMSYHSSFELPIEEEMI